jgi:hypothetical protein
MLIYKAGLTKEKGARTVTQRCMGCGQTSEFVLCSRKTGAGIGIPVVSIFTDKAILAKKSYALVCSLCAFSVNVERDRAAALKSS